MFSTLTMWVMRGPPPPSLAPVAFSFAFGHGLLNSCGWKCWNWLLLVFQSYPTSLPSVFRLACWVAAQFVLLHFLDVSKRKGELMMKLPAHFPGARKLGGVEPPSRQTASWRRSNFSIFLGKLLNYMTVTILIGSGYNSPIKTVYCPVTATQCFSWFGLLWFFGQWIILVYVIWHLEHQSVSEDRWPLKQDGYTSPRFGDIWIETSFSKNDREILEHTLREGLQKKPSFFLESIRAISKTSHLALGSHSILFSPPCPASDSVVSPLEAWYIFCNCSFWKVSIISSTFLSPTFETGESSSWDSSFSWHLHLGELSVIVPLDISSDDIPSLFLLSISRIWSPDLSMAMAMSMSMSNCQQCQIVNNDRPTCIS